MNGLPRLVRYDSGRAVIVSFGVSRPWRRNLHQARKEKRMSNRFEGKGNLGTEPVLKTVTIAGEDRQVAEMRVFFDEYSRNAAGELEQTGGFWLPVSLWDERGLRAARLLRKGARVRVVGQLRPFDYTPEGTDVRVPAFHLLAEEISLTLARVDEVRFAAKREVEGAGA